MAKILLVDDDSSSRALYRLVLESAGHRVLDVPDGGAGLQLALREVPDVVVALVTDEELEGARGEAVARRLAMSPVTEKIPIIGVTPGPLGSARRARLERLFYRLMARPRQPITLVKAVRSALGASRTSAS